MSPFRPLACIAGLGLMAAACTPADDDRAAAPAADTPTKTVVETREVQVPGPTTVVHEPVAVPTPPVVVERPAGDTTTVRAGRDGVEVETTNR